jgi:isoleucyl-tRNA synthetase
MSKRTLNFATPPDLPALETQTQAFWEQNETFKKSVESKSADNAYVFYDGPPFATGMPHYGHLLASTTKDVIPRFQTMQGKRVERVWGWDCHGLPIENMIEKNLGIKGGKKGIEALGIDTFNAACRSEVLRLDTEWERIIGRLGRWVDFEHSYKTMDKNFMESVWWGFQRLHQEGHVYEGRKVILYCPRCATPLSNFEIAMDNSYQTVTEPANTYKYSVKGHENTYLLAWSTTPWNKLATPALAVNPTLTYVKVKQANEYYVLAETTLKNLTKAPYEVVEKYVGQDLTSWEFEPHYDFYPHRENGEKFGVVIADPFVTADEGTGVVTLAIYGEDDYRVMLANNVQLVEHVDSEGKLKPEVTQWAGLDILAANPLVNADLMARGLVYDEQPHTHSVATCYRCSTRLYYAPLPAWFINIAQLRARLLKENEKVSWYPKHLKHGRFMKGLENAPDWNISRSRYWGTPMPIWRGTDVAGQEVLRIVGSLAELQQWAVEPEKVAALTDIHREFLDDLEVWVDEAKTIKGTRIPEVFDCWVESGSMPFAAKHYPFENKAEFEKTYPAQFVSEYIAQTRAWFYTMHVMSVAIFNQPPFEHVLTTGTILAEDGSKMSKSKKNYPDPMILIDKYGVDSLRLYMMASPVMKSENLNFSEKEVADIRRKVFVIWWNVLGFYETFGQPNQSLAAPTTVPEHVMDQWLVSAVKGLVAEVTQHFASYDIVRASRALMEFVDLLSTWYLRLSRDRIKDLAYPETTQVFGYALYTLAQLFAPIAPFFAELVHQVLKDEASSVHLTDWPVASSLTSAEVSLNAEMLQVRKLVESAHAVRKALGVKVRQPLASVTLTVGAELVNAAKLEAVIQAELNVKVVEWQVGANETVPAFDTELTPELKAEGEARELMRSIQNLRKTAGLKPGEVTRVAAPSWPSEWQAEIERKTTSQLVIGPELALLPTSA